MMAMVSLGLFLSVNPYISLFDGGITIMIYSYKWNLTDRRSENSIMGSWFNAQDYVVPQPQYQGSASLRMLNMCLLQYVLYCDNLSRNQYFVKFYNK